LKYGIENSMTPEKMREIVLPFISQFSVIPIFDSLDVYAKEKARLRKQGLLVDDFDILIAATTVSANMIMVTNNVAHLSRLSDIIIEDWTKK
jgi:tRNA(fMet)-specific endonuclease VapC